MFFFRISNFDKENKELSLIFELQQLLYEKWFIDIPKLIDFCLIYGESNQMEVKNILGRIMAMSWMNKQDDSPIKYPQNDFIDTIKLIGEKFVPNIS